MIRVDINKMHEKVGSKYSLVEVSSKVAKNLIQSDCDKRERGQKKPADAYDIKDSSKYLTESVEAIQNDRVEVVKK